jgi:hypothetical protein
VFPKLGDRPPNTAVANGNAWMELAWDDPNGATLATLPTWVNPYKNHPGLCGWDLADEVDLRQSNAANLRQMYDALVALDPNPAHPIQVVIRYPYRTSNPNGKQYVDALPNVPRVWIAIDPYVIPYGPASQVGQEVAATVAAVGARTTASIIQTFSWGTTFGTNPPGRIPTAAEVQAMGTGSLQAGAKSVFLYTWADNSMHPGQVMSQFNPGAWTALGSITGVWRTTMPAAARIFVPLPPTGRRSLVGRPGPQQAVAVDAADAGPGPGEETVRHGVLIEGAKSSIPTRRAGGCRAEREHPALPLSAPRGFEPVRVLVMGLLAFACGAAYAPFCEPP